MKKIKNLLVVLLFLNFMNGYAQYPFQQSFTIDGTQINSSTHPYIALRDISSGCISTSPSCLPNYKQANLVIKARIGSNVFKYANLNFAYIFSITPLLKKCDGTKWNLSPNIENIDINPFQSGNDFNLTMQLDQNNPEATFKLKLDENYNTANSTSGIPILQKLNSNLTNNIGILQFDFTVIRNTLNINPQDIIVDVYIEEVKSDYVGISTPIQINQVNGITNPVEFNWNTCPAPLYEVQILRLYNKDDNSLIPNIITANKQDINWDNALKLYIKGSSPNVLSSIVSKNLTIAEGSGYYAWRVRAINDKEANGSGNARNYGEWSTTPTISSAVGNFLIDNNTTLTDFSIFYYNQFDEDKNWIFSRSMIEDKELIEGSNLKGDIIGEEITYANGLGMQKQAQGLRNNPDGFRKHLLISNSYQDYVGRSVINTLPIAYFGQTELKYIDNLGGVYGPSDFDADINYLTPNVINGAIANYYSNNNKDIDVPNADGFPFSRTIYANDPLNRPVQSSMAGATLGLTQANTAADFKDDHSTRYMIDAATDIELQRMFGDEAPPSSSVIKNYVINPNGETSISYTGINGQVIATCLTSPKSEYLEPLPFTPFKNTFTVNNNTKNGNFELVATETKAFPEKLTSVTLNYQLLEQSNHDACKLICENCDYDITLSVALSNDPLNYVWQQNLKYYGAGSLSTDPCTNQPSSLQNVNIPNNSIVLKRGEYVFKKVVTFHNKDGAGNIIHDQVINQYHTIIEDKLWNKSNTNTNWDVLDENHAPLGIKVNIFDLQSQLQNGNMFNSSGVYEMLAVKPIVPSTIRFLTIGVGNCTEEIKLVVQGCQDNIGVPVVIAQGLIDGFQLKLNGIINYPQLNVPASNFYFLNNALFQFNLGTNQIQLNDQDVKTIFVNMMTDPDKLYTQTQITDAWDMATDWFINTKKSLITSGNPSNIPDPDLIDKFLTIAGYHLAFSTDVGNQGNSSFLPYGFITHPYRCFYYPPSPTSNWPSSIANQASITDNFGYMITPNCQVFSSPNFNLYPPINPVPCQVFDEQTMLMYFKSIQYPISSSIVITPPGGGASLTPDEAKTYATETEQNCKDICDAKRDAIFASVSQEIIVNQKTYNWEFVEDVNTPLNAFTSINQPKFAAIQWVDVIVNQIVENCKSKCNVTVTVKNGQVTEVGTPQEIANINKVLIGNIKVYSTNPNNLNPTIDNTNSSNSNVCISCLDAAGNPINGGNCNTALQSESYLNTLTHLMYLPSGAQLLPTIEGKEYCGCCPEPPAKYSNIPMEHSDPQRLVDWSRRLMLESDRYNSAVYNMIPWLNKKVSQISAGMAAGAKTINIYDLVYNYLNPIAYPDATTSDVSFLADDNTGMPGQLPSTPILNGHSKEINYNSNHKCEFSIGFPIYTSYTTTNGFTINRKEYSQLGLHGSMKVTVEIIPPATIAAGDKFTYYEDLKDYSSCTGSGGATMPPFKFSSDRNYMLVEHTFTSNSQDPYNFTYNLQVYKNNADKTYNLTNQKLFDAYSCHNVNTSYDPSHGTTLTAFLAYFPNSFSKYNLQFDYSLSFFSSTLAGTTDNYKNINHVLIPLLRKYDPTLPPIKQQFAGANTPDYLVEKEYNIAGGALMANTNGLMVSNEVVQVLDLYYSDYYNPNPTQIPPQPSLQPTFLWDLSNFKVSWPSIMCLQYTPVEIPPFVQPQTNTCQQNVAINVLSQLASKVDDIIQTKIANYELQYTANCINSFQDNFSIDYQCNYHHYTLLYYDRAGNRIRSVMPKGVNLLPVPSWTTSTNHSFITKYEYNSLNQVIQSTSPDAGTTKFLYDALGRVRCTQDAEQAINNNISYIKYDYLGRAIESGEATGINWASIDLSNDNFPLSTRNDVVYTYYTNNYKIGTNNLTYFNAGPIQTNLLNRVSYAISDKDGLLSTTNDQVVNAFSYDPHGNMVWMYQKIANLPPSFLRYDYDILSGAILQSVYNEWEIDALWHKYTYDGNKQLSTVTTSTDGIQYSTDATYQYYNHGPLKQVTTGHDQIQRLDYAYTINGWLKGLNHISLENNVDNLGANTSFDTKDLFAYKLHYFENDFNRQNTTGINSIFNTQDAYNYNLDINPQKTDFNLYDGNIAATFTGMKTLSGMKTNPLQADAEAYRYANVYKYDELNRLLTSTYYEQRTIGSRTMDNASNPFAFTENIAYEANGNITIANKYDYHGQIIDNLNYIYNSTNNQLAFVNEPISTPNLPDDYDIKANNVANNLFYYYANGNLSADVAQGLTILWDHNNRLSNYTKVKGSTNTTVSYLYNCMGQRVLTQTTDNTNALPTKLQAIARDASGKPIANYTWQKANASSNYVYSLTDQPLYGAARLGIIKRNLIANIVVGTPLLNSSQAYVQTPINTIQNSRVLCYRTLHTHTYEYTDHLGNVRLTYTDVKTYTLSGTAPNITFSATATAQTLSYYNTYAFGMPKGQGDNTIAQLGMFYFENPSGNYLYGFNGQQKVDDIAGAGNHNTAQFWEYDTRLGRRWNLDPIDQVNVSNYAVMYDNPIAMNDVEGDDPKKHGKNNTRNDKEKKWDVTNSKKGGHGGHSGHSHRGTKVYSYDGENRPNNNSGGGAGKPYNSVSPATTYATALRCPNCPQPIAYEIRHMAEEGKFVNGINPYTHRPTYTPATGKIDYPKTDPVFFIVSLGSSAALRFGASLFSDEVILESIAAKGGSEAASVLSKGDLLRIENAATRINKPISVVGSRASGKAGALSDWDYVIEGLNNKDWKQIKNSLPGSKSVMDNMPRNIEIFKVPVNTNLPYITIYPH